MLFTKHSQKSGRNSDSTGFMMLVSVLTTLLLVHASLAREIEIFSEEDTARLDMIIAAGDRGELPEGEPEYLDYLRATGRYEEYAKVMGIDDVSLVIPSEDARAEDFVFSKVSPLGDILLRPEQTEQARQAINLTRYGGSRWPNHVVPYTIASSDFSTSQRNLIIRNIDNLSSRLRNIDIVPRRSERDYVHVISGNGCYSYLGRTGRQQVLSLQKNGCLSNGTIQHEFIHAIGFTHEHNRPDRDNVVTILWDNIPEDWHSQYQKVENPDFVSHGQYEPCSSMHYPMNAPGTNKPAFEFHDRSTDKSCIGQRHGATARDCQKIDQMYS